MSAETTTRVRTPFEQTVTEILDMREDDKTQQTAKMGRLASILIKQEDKTNETRRLLAKEEKLLLNIQHGFERVSSLMVGKTMDAATKALAEKDDEIAQLKEQLAKSVNKAVVK